MAVSARFLDAIRDVLGFVPELRLKRMFGGAGVYSGALMFALAIDDALYLKSDAETDDAFAALGLEPFLYRGRTGEPRPMSYRQAPDDLWEDEDTARDWGRPRARRRRPQGALSLFGAGGLGALPFLLHAEHAPAPSGDAGVRFVTRTQPQGVGSVTAAG